MRSSVLSTFSNNICFVVLLWGFPTPISLRTDFIRIPNIYLLSTLEMVTEEGAFLILEKTNLFIVFSWDVWRVGVFK